MTVEKRNQRKVLEGWVLSDRMDKTRSVRILRRFRHALYEKVMTRYTKVYAHDEKNESHQGDRVQIMSIRPMSKLKRWRVVRVLEKAKIAAVALKGDAS
ncbi:MAG TPA: 30S ribosomal protein S17 [Elusimicrobiota bacterium]|nr:30S ribosomal protein S17 [Elusimicrobiota bacterium]